MPAISSFQQFERVSDKIGGAAALRLFSFYSTIGSHVYIPESATEGHVLERLIGRRAFLDLVAAFRGENVPVSRLEVEPIRNAARVWTLVNKNVSKQSIAALLGVSTARVSQIARQLEEEGFGSLEDEFILSGVADHV